MHQSSTNMQSAGDRRIPTARCRSGGTRPWIPCKRRWGESTDKGWGAGAQHRFRMSHVQEHHDSWFGIILLYITSSMNQSIQSQRTMGLSPSKLFFDNTFGSQLELADIQQGELSWSIMSHHDSPSSAIARSLVKTGKHPLLQRKPTQKGSETQWISFMFTCFWWSPYSWWALRAKIWWINNE